MTTSFGDYIRTARENLQAQHPGEYSLRALALRLDVTHAYLNKIEHGEGSVPAEKTIVALARELKLDANVLLAMAGKVSDELQAIIRQRPQLFAEMLAACKDLPNDAILKLVREVRDGDW